MKKLKQWFKDKIVFICIVLYIGLAIGGYFIINTNFSKDALSYFGTVLAGFGTIIIGLVAFNQNEKANIISQNANENSKKANELNERLILLEEERNIKCLIVDDSKCSCYYQVDTNTIVFGIEFINISDRIIYFNDISNLYIHTANSNDIMNLKYIDDLISFHSCPPQSSFSLVVHGDCSKEFYSKVKSENNKCLYLYSNFLLTYCDAYEQRTNTFNYTFIIQKQKGEEDCSINCCSIEINK